QVLAGVHGDYAGGLARGARVDAPDARMRMRAAHERGVGGAGELDVIDVDSLAGDQPGILPALDAGAEQAFRRGHGSPRSAVPAILPAACCTALTMLA